jgi:hypothetical protein
VVVVPSGIPRHVSDSVALHDQDLTPRGFPKPVGREGQSRLWNRREVENVA